MLKIGIGDWFLARSDAFRLLLGKFRDHKITTRNSFVRVKQKHRLYDKKINEHDFRIKKMEMLLSNTEVPITIIKKKKK